MHMGLAPAVNPEHYTYFWGYPAERREQAPALHWLYSINQWFLNDLAVGLLPPLIVNQGIRRGGKSSPCDNPRLLMHRLTMYKRRV